MDVQIESPMHWEKMKLMTNPFPYSRWVRKRAMMVLNRAVIRSDLINRFLSITMLFICWVFENKGILHRSSLFQNDSFLQYTQENQRRKGR